VIDKKAGDLEVVVHDREGKRGVEHLLHSGLAPFGVPANPVIIGGKMMREVAQRGPPRGVEPMFDPCEVPAPATCGKSSGMGQDSH
jgi:hypothetical protein